MANQSVRDVAVLLERLYKRPFAGKTPGGNGMRFQISERNLKRLSKRERLRESFISELQNELYESGFTFTYIDGGFAMIRTSVLQGYRKVPSAVVITLIVGGLGEVEEEENLDDTLVEDTDQHDD